MSDSFMDELGHVTHLVDDAVRTGDFSQLSDRIGDAVQRAAETVTGNPMDADYEQVPPPFRAQVNRRNEQAEHARRMRMEAEQRRQARMQREAYEDQYFARPQDPGGGTVMAVIGGIVAVIFLALALFFGLIASYAWTNAALFLPVFNALIAACGVFVAVKGMRISKKARRFNSYRNLLLPKLYMDVKDLSKQTGVSKDQVTAELEEFTEKGMIRQGHFDDSKKTFMASDAIYRDYRETQARSDELKREQKAQRAKEARASQAAQTTKAAKSEGAQYSPEVKSILEKGNEYIADIHAANDAIEDPVVSEKLDRMEQIVRRIFDEVRKRPSLAKGLDMFMDYYLPTTTKLIWAYDSLNRQGVHGENITNAQKEIVASLDTINDAFEKLLDGFFKETAMDVSSDINVMKMMMKQEGLTSDDMSAMRKEHEAAQTPAEPESPKTLTAPWDTSGGAQAQALEEEK